MLNKAKTEVAQVFFKKLAHLFYAIGMADKKFLRQEKIAIIDIVEKGGFSQIDTNASKDIIYQTLKELIENKVKHVVAFDIFKKFFSENKHLFPENLRFEIQKAVKQILDANERKDKSEIVILSKLHLLFKE